MATNIVRTTQEHFGTIQCQYFTLQLRYPKVHTRPSVSCVANFPQQLGCFFSPCTKHFLYFYYNLLCFNGALSTTASYFCPRMAIVKRFNCSVKRVVSARRTKLSRVIQNQHNKGLFSGKTMLKLL